MIKVRRDVMGLSKQQICEDARDKKLSKGLLECGTLVRGCLCMYDADGYDEQGEI